MTNPYTPTYNYQKTTQNLLAIQALTTDGRVVSSSSIDVSAYTKASIFIRMGRQTESAFTAGVNFKIQGLSKSGGNNWFDITVFTSALGSSVASEAVNGTCAAGQAVVGMASTTGFAVGNYVFISNSTIANSEFAMINVLTTNTSVTLNDNLAKAQTGSTVYNQAERYYAQIDCSTLNNIRVVVDGTGAGQNFVVEADAVIGV